MPSYDYPTSMTGLIGQARRDIHRLARNYPIHQVRYKRTGAFSAAFTGQDTYPNLSGQDRQIIAVHYHLDVAASTTATVVDLKIDGTTAYTTSANRPSLATGATEGDATLPDVTTWPAGSLLRVDGITGDAAAVGPSLTIAFL